ncbi:MAG: hypothetical protein MJ232_04605 [archaeon]|nr:hypothetical protein [archaeon]
MSIFKIIVLGVIVVLIMPYLTNLLTLIGFVLPSSLVNIISLCIVISVVLWVVRD